LLALNWVWAAWGLPQHHWRPHAPSLLWLQSQRVDRWHLARKEPRALLLLATKAPLACSVKRWQPLGQQSQQCAWSNYAPYSLAAVGTRTDGGPWACLQWFWAIAFAHSTGGSLASSTCFAA